LKYLQTFVLPTLQLWHLHDDRGWHKYSAQDECSLSAILCRLNGDTITNFQVCNVLANLNDTARRFVPERKWFLDHLPKATMDIVVDLILLEKWLGGTEIVRTSLPHMPVDSTRTNTASSCT
jgi:hypothetical protein